MECPPAPMKRKLLTYNHITSEWEHLPVKIEMPCPPAPKKKTIQTYNSFIGKWEYNPF